jgi:hypothetical protein
MKVAGQLLTFIVVKHYIRIRKNTNETFMKLFRLLLPLPSARFRGGIIERYITLCLAVMQ